MNKVEYLMNIRDASNASIFTYFFNKKIKSYHNIFFFFLQTCVSIRMIDNITHSYQFNKRADFCLSRSLFRRS